tara:strand:- start:1223 stop:1576 length:354 start_codon:yes stop_codon:yes gene_type:complete
MSKIYTTLESPVDLRKQILKANMGVIELLEDLENIKELKHNKHNTFLYLRAYIKEIHSAITGLRMRFPHMKFSEEEELKKESEKVHLEFEGYVKDNKEIDKLERELFVIKEKLKDFS